MSAPRVAEFLGVEKCIHSKRWWADQHARFERPADMRLLAEYLTPEQREDLAEYGCFVFETERGDFKHAYPVGHYSGRCLRPSEGIPESIPWMLAVKLVWQADQAGVERVMGHEGAVLT